MAIPSTWTTMPPDTPTTGSSYNYGVRVVSELPIPSTPI